MDSITLPFHRKDAKDAENPYREGVVAVSYQLSAIRYQPPLGGVLKADG